MLRKLLAYILLFAHINTSMFIPQMDEEVDMYDNAGNQIDDINTLIEFIDQDVLGHYDTSPEDEDDDTGRPLHVIKIVDYSYHPYFEELQTKVAIKEKPEVIFTGYVEHKLTAGFKNILLPPPKQATA
ncbi:MULTISPECIES: hypothetical protein [Niastella]|uniref:Uncharacterized protein n=1 Tax=Niastella soli TaxID=2821487 RepID=A0ABS3Z3H7_9BACT|nr:hypothetical protein [Niastella soli]MBO9204722.1 hypothetical protein [Niastella soli]